MLHRIGRLTSTITSTYDKRVIGYLLLSRLWGILSGPCTVFLIALHLSPELQGYYYTFTSIMAFQTFIELGFTSVFSSHLTHEWTLSRQEGSLAQSAQRRFGEILYLGLRWYGAAAILFFILFTFIGIFFFTSKETNLNSAIAPWICFCISISLGFLVAGLRAVFEALNKLKELHRILLFNSLINSCCLWLALLLHQELFALSIASFVAHVITLLLLLPFALNLYRTTRSKDSGSTYSWKKEFLPQQWRIAASWCCGALMFHSFTPLMFLYGGSVEAGQLGMIMQIFHIANNFCMIWVTIANPHFASLGAVQNWSEIMRWYRATLVRTLYTGLFTLIGCISAVMAISFLHSPFLDRIGSLHALGIFLLCVLILQPLNVRTTLIRAQKKEPFLMSSLLSAAIITFSNFLCAKYFGIVGISYGFLISLLMITYPTVTYAFRREIRSAQYQPPHNDLKPTT